MNTNTTFPNNASNSSANASGVLQGTVQAVDKAADQVSSIAAAERTRRLANDTFDQLSSAVESARNSTVPALERLGAGAESLAKRSAETARLRSRQLRDQAQLRSEQAAAHIRDEPIKSVLIAAAAGAVVAMLFSLFRRD